MMACTVGRSCAKAAILMAASSGTAMAGSIFDGNGTESLIAPIKAMPTCGTNMSYAYFTSFVFLSSFLVS